jgi:hypothetical protein
MRIRVFPALAGMDTTFQEFMPKFEACSPRSRGWIGRMREAPARGYLQPVILAKTILWGGWLCRQPPQPFQAALSGRPVEGGAAAQTDNTSPRKD